MHCITRLGLGGAEQVAFSLVRGLRSEVDSAIFTVHGQGTDAVGASLAAELRMHNVPWFTGTGVPMKLGGMIPAGLAMARAVRHFRPEVIHFHSETPEACGAAMALLFPDLRHIGQVRTIHNSIFWRYWPRIGRWCDRQLAQARIACVSHAAREEFQRYRTDSGVLPPQQDPIVIYNGVGIAPRPPRKGSHHKGVVRLLFAGRLEPQKGADVLVAALSAVPLPENTTVELTFVGSGAQVPLVRMCAASPPSGWLVTVQPPVPDLPTLFSGYDLAVMPSRFEGLGLVAIEALLCGLPVVATSAPGLREVFPSDYPWLAKPADPTDLAAVIGRALQSAGDWESTVAAAQRYACERFSPEAMADSYLNLYRQIANTRCLNSVG